MASDSIWLVRADRTNVLVLAVLGMMSGALAWKLIDSADRIGANFDVEWSVFLVLPVSIFPGLVFGIAIGTFLWWRGRLTVPRLIGYVLAAGLSYFAAFHVAFHIISALSADRSVIGTMAGGVPAGLAGSLLLGLLSILLLRPGSRQPLRLPVAVGTALGALLAIIVDDHGAGLTWLGFFVLWQGAYAASLAPLLRHGAPASAVSGS